LSRSFGIDLAQYIKVPMEEPTDLAFTSEEQAFREEVRQFLRENVPPEMRRKLVEGAQLLKDEMWLDGAP